MFSLKMTNMICHTDQISGYIIDVSCDLRVCDSFGPIDCKVFIFIYLIIFRYKSMKVVISY